MMETTDPITSDHKAIARAMDAWGHAFTLETTDRIVDLYAADASLWGTLSPQQRTDTESIRDYFENAFTYEKRSVVFTSSHIRCFGDMAVSSGACTYSLEKDSERLTLPARFTLVYARRNGQWLIVEHHSSVLPDG